jgi:acetyl esterase/lipase
LPLDADIAAFLEKVGPDGFDALLPARPGQEALERSLTALRTLPARPVDPDDPLETHDEATLDGVPVRLYSLPGAPRPAPVVVFLHGGGWVLGDLDTHDHLCRRIARSGLLVVSVDYRLAPEHPFPAPLDDLGSALDWVVEHAAGFGGDPAQVVMLGISAGANLAAAQTLREAMGGSNRVAAQVLAYPVIDSRMGTRSHLKNASGYHLTARQIAWFWDQYVPRPEDRSNPLASLAHARSVEGLPPTVVLTAEYDVLRDEGDEFARRLDAAGVHVEHVEVPGAIHGFLAMPPQGSAAAAPALDDLIERTKRLTGMEPGLP